MKGNSSAQKDIQLDLAAMFKAAGDPMRLSILRIMQRDSYGVLELCRMFDVQQPSMSHHLKVLAKAGLVTTRREGNSIFYRRSNSMNSVKQAVLSSFFELLDRQAIDANLQATIDAAQKVRKEQSTEFFKANAHRFREQQDLIAGFGDYGQLVADMLGSSNQGTWMEVGPGDGALLVECVDRFDSVEVIDVSEEMLKESQARLPEPFQARTSFKHLDTAAALEAGIKADVISCNMVLHHVPSPADMVGDMAKMLNQGGRLLITDLDQHDQDWARESCGDLWLGFEPEQINGWAETAGLSEGRSEFLALRNGFGVQIREYLNS